MGGTFTSYNKVRAGAYFNFKSVPRPMIQVGNRGIATIPLELNWGETGTLIEVFSDELLNGDSLAKVGFTAYDSESKLLNLMLQNCYKVLVYRTNTNGTKATATLTSGEPVEEVYPNTLTITAKYKGTFGNSIIVSIVKNGTLFDVSTFVNGSQKDKQTVATVSELDANDFVTFEGTGVPTLSAGTALEGGTNGEAVAKATYYPLYLALLETAKFQAVACPDLLDADSTLKANLVTFIKNQRDEQGRYVQGVIANYTAANTEGIISVKNGIVVNDVNVTKEEATAVVAAITAGAEINESNTNKTIQGATDLIGKYTNSQIIDALNNGEFIFTSNSRGEIKVEKDINSLHTFTQDKNYVFSKNRVIRVLDEIGTSIQDIWEQSYMGKQNNDNDGRDIFKGDVIAYFTELQRIGAIQNFAGADDIDIRQGTDLDVVIVDAWIQPTDSMEKLYFTVNVIG